MVARIVRISWAACLAVLIATPGLAQEHKAGGLVINLGLMPAWKAMQVDGHREAHSHEFTSQTGSQHVLIVVADQKSGQRIGDARVVVQITDPKGLAQKKSLMRTQAAGMPDYSEVFEFGWTGTYVVQVSVVPKPGAKPVTTRFEVHHSL